jgi:glycosyltransferase involved in cell wall biosynthesis
MKIAHIVDSMEMGGAETLVAQLCRHQRSHGHEPSVHAHLRSGVIGEQLQKEGIRVAVHGPAHLPTITKRFHRLFRELRPDVVHCHNPTPAIYAAPAAKLNGAKAVIATRHSLVAPPYNYAQELKFSLAAQFCDWVVGICEATTENLRNAPLARESKITCVYNGTVPIAPSCHPRETDLLTLLCVGRLAAVKDHATLLRATALAVKRGVRLQLWIVGDGPERSALEREAQALGLIEQVIFYGEQTNVSRFFNSADAFVMSSVSEGLPVSLLQAMSVGLPGITTDVGGMGEVVKLAGCGITVPESDPENFASAICRMAASEELRKTFSGRARASFEKHFTLDAMANAYMRLYHSRS